MNGSSLEAEWIYLDRISEQWMEVMGLETLNQANGGMNGTPLTTASKIVR